MKKVLLYTAILTLLSCNPNDLDFDNLEGPTLNSRVAIPLGTLSYTMRDLLDEIGDDQLELEEDSSSLLMLTYYDTAFFDDAEDVISIDDVTNLTTINLPQTPASPSTVQINVDTTIIFSYPASNNEELDEVFYTSGLMSLMVNSNVSSDIDYTFTVQSTRLVSTDAPVVFNGSIAPNGSASNSQDLNNHRTDLTFENGENRFEMEVDLVITLDAGESINSGDNLSLQVDYTNQSFSLLYGKFGQDTLRVGSETLEVEFFEDLGDEGFKFGDPTINFTFESTFGVPLGLRFGGLYGVDSANNRVDTTYLSGNITQSLQRIADSEELGVPKQTTITVNKQNSSIQDLLAKSPNTIGFGLTAIANPLDPTNLNFVMDTSRLTTFIEIELPMALSLKDVTREVELDLGSGLDFDESDSVSIRLVTTNELPFAGELALSILDENDSVLYDVPQRLVLETPFLDLNGIVTTSRKHFTDIPFNQTGIDALRDGKTIKMTVILNTPGNTGRDIFVKILADYKLEVSVAAIGRLNYKL